MVKAIQTRLPAHGIGGHEMWNAWISYDPYEMAAECKAHKLKVLGHCDDIIPKRNFLNPDLILDIGVCAEYEDGEKFWCHWSQRAYHHMLASWEKRQRAGL